MGLITNILPIVDNVAFSNNFYCVLHNRGFEVDKTLIKDSHFDAFGFKAQSVTIDGTTINYKYLPELRKHFIDDVTKFKKVSISVTDIGYLRYYNYLRDVYNHIFDEKKNVFVSGNPDNKKIKASLYYFDRTIDVPSSIAQAKEIETRKKYIMKFSGTFFIESVPQLQFSYTESKPIGFTFSLVTDNLEITTNF